MTAFYVAPFHPGNWASMSSGLKIDPTWYQKCLSDDWDGVKFYDDLKGSSLAWDLSIPTEGSLVYGILHDNLQTVSLDTPFEDFFLWHRNIISSDYKLYLFNDSSSNNLELSLNTTIEEIRQFCGDTPGNRQLE